ncbi:protein FAR1-RELATED SEQUENCE 8-like [Silene latifolia]|uniref:protein FAR1-RELATED SEQUENCE 8-like n=1 Tax=Silene latifolia TaxID=37657 RepID=UPI003D77B126
MAHTDVEEVDPPTKGMSFANGDEFGAYCYLYAYQCVVQFFIRGMAKVFADAVSYDATFLCNRYKMPFTPFVGVNHYGNTVVLASALISHEDAISFTWVFRRWLDCMGRAPSVIITDQCKGIGKAVKDIFPNTPHRLCLWHMMRNGAKNLKANPRYNEIKTDLTDVVYESKDIDDFEED